MRLMYEYIKSGFIYIIAFLFVLHISFILSACNTTTNPNNQLNLTSQSDFPNNITICRNPTIIGIGISVGVDIIGNRIANLSSIGSNIRLGASVDDIFHIYVPSQLGSLKKRDLIRFKLPPGDSFFMIENKLDWEQGIYAYISDAAWARALDGPIDVQIAISMGEINSALNGKKDTVIWNLRNNNKESVYIYKSGNWAVKMVSESFYKANCAGA